MIRFRVRAAVCVCVVVCAVVALPAGAGASGHPSAGVVHASGDLADLSPATDDPTDGASAAAIAVSRSAHGTVVALRVRGVDRSAVGTRFGAHVHVGPCVPGDGAAAGPHYNSVGGSVVDPTTEVWLDFTVRADGTAVAVAVVPFVVPPGGARSIVIHAIATMPNGAAGARLACLPFEL
jgi:Cu/Zn superoxide dismutase